ncbi:TPA: aminopeptidase P family protein [archaeon]|uniref:Aminopeptidase P family protein n=1 Tax=Candidatus Naiadarchaeum limnaeum TaxID=2756139 RepID=A0A832UVT6_9ARCH|nr:aminopeptidase P family protein [Candidatus Naiadarchaeum limnaeum]
MIGKEQTENLRKELEKKKLDALLLINFSSEHIDNTLYYFTGIEWVEHSYAIIGKDFEKLYLPQFEIERCEKETWIKQIEELPKQKTLENITKSLRGKKVGINGEFLPANTFEKLKAKLKLTDFSSAIKNLRIIKTQGEIALIKKAANITAKFYQNLDFSKNETQISADIGFICAQNNAKLAFDPIVAYDSNSALPHAKTTLNNGNGALLIDSGAAYKGYHADVTRTFSLKENDTEFEKIYDLVLNVQEKAIEKVKPGVKANAIDNFVRGELKKKGYKFIHSTGHGIGLEIHEAPAIAEKSKEILKENMICTIEPGIYLSGKFGVRIEDDILVTKDGCEVLTKGIKK